MFDQIALVRERLGTELTFERVLLSVTFLMLS